MWNDKSARWIACKTPWISWLLLATQRPLFDTNKTNEPLVGSVDLFSTIQSTIHRNCYAFYGSIANEWGIARHVLPIFVCVCLRLSMFDCANYLNVSLNWRLLRKIDLTILKFPACIRTHVQLDSFFCLSKYSTEQKTLTFDKKF